MAIDKTMLSEISQILGEEVSIDRKSLSSINISTYEMQETYKEREPYAVIKTLMGDRYVWTESFINKVLYSMSTDDLTDMNPLEYRIMMGFITFQDRHSTINNTTQIGKGAIGCTNKNESGISYAVYKDGISSEERLEAAFDVPRDSVYKSLDRALLYILDCEDWRTKDVKSGELIDVQP